MTDYRYVHHRAVATLSACLSVLAFGLFVLAAPQASAGILFQDDFNDNSLDPAKWMTSVAIPQGGASVSEINQHAELVARGHLATVPQFDPTAFAGGILVTGQWTSVNQGGHDFFQVLTRSDGLPDPGNCCGETQNGIEFFVDVNGTAQQLDIRTKGGSLGVNGQSRIGSVTFSQGSVFDFSILDAGSHLSFTMTEVGNAANTATTTAFVDRDTFNLNHVTFHNRESDGRTVYLDNVVITDPAPAPPPPPPPPSLTYDFSLRQDLQGWTVLNGVANFRTGDGGGMGPANPGNTDYAHDNAHPTFLVESPEIFLDPTLQPGDEAMVWVTAGGAGDQAGNGPDFANPAAVLAFNGGQSNEQGEKGLAFLNVSTGQYDAVLFNQDNGGTDTNSLTLADLVAAGVDPSQIYKLQYYENDQVGWGWGQLNSIDIQLGNPIPEPSTLVLATLGLLGLFGRAGRRRHRA
jgi:hypothetical protein